MNFCKLKKEVSIELKFQVLYIHSIIISSYNFNQILIIKNNIKRQRYMANISYYIIYIFLFTYIYFIIYVFIFYIMTVRLDVGKVPFSEIRRFRHYSNLYQILYPNCQVLRKIVWFQGLDNKRHNYEIFWGGLDYKMDRMWLVRELVVAGIPPLVDAVLWSWHFRIYNHKFLTSKLPLCLIFSKIDSFICSIFYQFCVNLKGYVYPAILTNITTLFWTICVRKYR